MRTVCNTELSSCRRGGARVIERGLGRTCGCRRRPPTETAPQIKREKPEADDRNLRGDEEHHPLEGSIHETVGVQTDAEHIDAEPGETGNDIADNRQVHDTTFTNHPAPTRMEDESVPDDD